MMMIQSSLSYKKSGPVSSTAEFEGNGYDKGDIRWYCWRWWSREVLRWSFPTLAIKCLVHFHPPSPSDDSYLSLKRTKEGQEKMLTSFKPYQICECYRYKILIFWFLLKASTEKRLQIHELLRWKIVTRIQKHSSMMRNVSKCERMLDSPKSL